MAIKKLINDDNTTLTFRDTETEETMAFNIGDLSGTMIERLAIHGLSQKLGDSYSGKTGWHESMAAVADVWHGLRDDQWSTGGSGGQLAEALHNVTGKPLEECIAKVKGMHQEAKKELRKHPQIAAWIAAENAKRKARKAEGADTQDLNELF